jgi:polar amino acid transport system permease protein
VRASLDWAFILDHLPELARGLERTLEVSALGILGALAIGVLLGAARAFRVPVVSQLAAVYVEIIRNTPILAWIFLIFFGLPRALDIRLTPFEAALIAVTLTGGAYNTENYRAAFQAVPRRLQEAGIALGFGPIRNFFSVTLPIGGRIALPSTINTYASVLKNTALTTAIGFQELTNTAYSIASFNFKDFEMFTVLALVYLTLVWSLSGLIRLLEGRLALPEAI